MADFATLRRTHATRFASGVRRHVVVHQEVIAEIAGQRLNNLLVTTSTEGGHDQGLRFATGKQGGTMRTRQHAGTNGDRTYGAGVTTIDTRLTGQDATTHDLGFEGMEQILDHVGLGGVHIRRNQFAKYAAADGIHFSLPRLFLLDRVGGGKCVRTQAIHFFQQRSIRYRRRPFPRIFAAFVGQIINRVDNYL